jgi:hypothetical protein
MRDPKRIERILSLLKIYWTKYPDLRLGQILGNAVPSIHGRTLDGQPSVAPGNIYAYEDVKFEAWLRSQTPVLDQLAVEAPRRGEL